MNAVLTDVHRHAWDSEAVQVMTKQLNYAVAKKKISDQLAKADRCHGGILTFAQYEPIANEDTKRAVEVLRAYEGRGRFMLELAEKARRGGGLWVPSQKQTEVVLRIAAEDAA